MKSSIYATNEYRIQQIHIKFSRRKLDIAIPVKGKGLIDAKRFKKLNSVN